MSSASYHSSPTSSAPPPTLWKGTDERAAAPARFMSRARPRPSVENLFSCTASSSAAEPLSAFIAYAMNRTQVPAAVLTGALVLLARLKSRFAQAKAASANRLFLAALMISQKQLCDGSFSSASWCIVAQGRWSIRDVNRMEKEFLEYLAWSVTLSSPEMSHIDHIIYRDYCDQPIASSSRSRPLASSAPLPPSAPTAPLYDPTQSYPSPSSSPAYSAPSSSSPSNMYSSHHSSPSSLDTPLHTPSHSTTPSECDDSDADWSPLPSKAEIEADVDVADADDEDEDEAVSDMKRRLISNLRRDTLTPAGARFLPQSH